jgi:hypothetical protein
MLLEFPIGELVQDLPRRTGHPALVVETEKPTIDVVGIAHMNTALPVWTELPAASCTDCTSSQPASPVPPSCQRPRGVGPLRQTGFCPA